MLSAFLKRFSRIPKLIKSGRMTKTKPFEGPELKCKGIRALIPIRLAFDLVGNTEVRGIGKRFTFVYENPISMSYLNDFGHRYA